MSNPIKFYFVCVSPWSYLAIDKLKDIALSNQRQIDFRPIDVAVSWKITGAGQPLNKRPEVLQAYRIIELQRWAKWRNINININPKFFPVPFALSSRVIIAALESNPGKEFELTRALMRGCWEDEKDISNTDHVRDIIEKVGLDGSELIQIANSEKTSEKLISNTYEAIEFGAWSVPSFYFDGELFFGQDRLEMIDWKISSKV